jgi:N-acetylmuramoyl-L-alanine amidase
MNSYNKKTPMQLYCSVITIIICSLALCGGLAGCTNPQLVNDKAHLPQHQDSVPLSRIAQEMSLYVAWDPVEKKALLAQDEVHIIIEPGSQIALICGEAKNMPFAAYVEQAEIYISATFYQQEIATVLAVAKQANGEKESDKEILPEILAWQPAPTKTEAIQVIVDAGHGGHDPGAKIVGGGSEKTLTLAIAQKLLAHLQRQGVAAKMTRTGDIYIAREERVKLANALQALCFVSVHLNSAPVPSASGFEIWISPDANKTRYAKSLRLARHVRAALKKNLPLRDRGIRRNDFQVIRDTTMPAVLVECAFVSNEQDLAWISDAEKQEQLTAAMAQGILSFLTSLRK